MSATVEPQLWPKGRAWTRSKVSSSPPNAAALVKLLRSNSTRTFAQMHFPRTYRSAAGESHMSDSDGQPWDWGSLTDILQDGLRAQSFPQSEPSEERCSHWLLRACKLQAAQLAHHYRNHQLSAGCRPNCGGSHLSRDGQEPQHWGPDRQRHRCNRSSL